MYENIVLNKENGIATITLKRPEALNALNRDLLIELSRAIENDINDCKALIITGDGRAFAAGADISAQMNFTQEEASAWSEFGNGIFRRIELLDIPTVAAVNGFALGGGCELAMSCDMIFASEKAKFGQPEVTLGVTPGFAGSVRLPRIVGASKALELLISGEIINAEGAHRIGLANRVYAPEELIPQTKEFLGKVISLGPVAIVNCKKSVRTGMGMNLDDAIKNESTLFGECFVNGEGREGMHAFVEKRAADFINGEYIVK